MKKKLSSLLVAGTMASVLPLSIAQADETKVYGKLHLNYGTYEEKSGSTTVEDNWQLNSYASRFGVKGSKDLDGGLQAIYKLEWEVNPDGDNTEEFDVEDGSQADNTDAVTIEDSGTAGFSRRNMYVGLKGGFGELRFGRHDTPLKLVQGKFDQFNDTLGDLKHAGDEDGENRVDNVLAYLGKAGEINFTIALIPSEGDGTTAGDGPADSYSASISYSTGPLYVGVAMDSYDDTAGADENSLARLVAIYKMSDMQFGLLWQSGVEAPDTSAAKEDWIGLSFNTKFGGNNKFKAQYIMVEDSAATPLEGTLLAVGIDHNLDKKNKVYVMYTALEEEAGGTTTKEVNSLSVGMVSGF